MRKRPFSVEWHIAESDAEWEALRATPADIPAATGPSPRRQWLGTLLVIGLMALGIWGWQSRQVMPTDGAAAVATVDGAALVEPAVVDSDTNILAGSVEVPARPLPDRGGPFDADVARMVEHPEWGIHAYQTVEEPLRAVLAGGLWGAEQELVTTYFHLHFRQLDAKTVAAAGPQLDALYATMRQNFGLTTPPPAIKLHIQVSEQYLRATVPYRPRNVDQLTVSSPALYPTLAPWTAADLFTQSVVLLLVDQLLAEAVTQHKIGAARDPLLHGLRLWQLWDLTLPLATHQQALVQWIYRDLPPVQPAAALPMPADYPLFCTIHQLWMDHPAQLQLPFLCTEQDRLPGRLAPRLLQQPPTQLPPLHAPIYLDEEADGQGRTRAIAHPGQAIALATVVDYIVVTYGRARLADFVANLNRYTRWEELIPALFGLSAAEFEVDWQRFVSAEGRFP